MDFLKSFAFRIFDINPYNLDIINFYLFLIFLIVIFFMFYRQASIGRAVDSLEAKHRELLRRLDAIAGCMERKEKFKLERRLWALEQNTYNKPFQQKTFS